MCLVSLAMLMAAGCGDDKGSPAGASLGPPDAAMGPSPERVDAGATKDSPAGDGMSAADGSLTDAGKPDSGPVAPPLLSTGGGSACDTCERNKCGSGNNNLAARCLLDPGKAVAGPRKDAPKSELCAAVLACIRSSGCAATSVEECYCGPGISPESCSGGGAKGPCKAVLEGAAESADAKVVLARMFDPNFATGNASTLIEQCDREQCAGICRLKATSTATCTMLPPPTGGGPADCPDLDGNCVRDCGETLTKNPGLEADASSWQAEANVTVAREQRDAMGRPTSGALSVLHGSKTGLTAAAMAGARQCVTVTAGTVYQLAAQVLIPEGQSPGSASLSAIFHAAADCAGPPAAAPSPIPLWGDRDRWMTVSAGVLAPAGAQSMTLRLVVIKRLQDPPLKALFDNVLVSPR